jgi:hypothetical protein
LDGTGRKAVLGSELTRDFLIKLLRGRLEVGGERDGGGYKNGGDRFK